MLNLTLTIKLEAKEGITPTEVQQALDAVKARLVFNGRLLEDPEAEYAIENVYGRKLGTWSVS